MNNLSKTKTIVLTALFAAMIFLTTAYLFHIPTGASGYIHLGDAFVYLAASILPGPYGLIAASIGGGMADILTGNAVWAIPTMLIKPAMAFCFTEKGKSIICKRNTIAVFIAGIICIAGYYLAEGFIYGNFVAPMAGIGFNSIQAIGSAIVYLTIGFALDKVKAREKLARN